MPVSIATARDPFRGKGKPPADLSLRTPQARVLAALMPYDPSDHISEWPLLNRAALAVSAGYTAISGTVTRVLNGISPGSSSGDPHPGLLTRAFVEIVQINIDGTTEQNYRATPAGVKAYQLYVQNGKKLPKVRDASLCTNLRYEKE